MSLHICAALWFSLSPAVVPFARRGYPVWSLIVQGALSVILSLVILGVPALVGRGIRRQVERGRWPPWAVPAVAAGAVAAVGLLFLVTWIIWG